MSSLERIVVDPNILCGKPVVKGTRIPVYIILKTLESLKTFDKVMEQYPGISVEDIQAVLLFASQLADFTEISISQEG